MPHSLLHPPIQFQRIPDALKYAPPRFPTLVPSFAWPLGRLATWPPKKNQVGKGGKWWEGLGKDGKNPIFPARNRGFEPPFPTIGGTAPVSGPFLDSSFPGFLIAVIHVVKEQRRLPRPGIDQIAWLLPPAPTTDGINSNTPPSIVKSSELSVAS